MDHGWLVFVAQIDGRFHADSSKGSSSEAGFWLWWLPWKRSCTSGGVRGQLRVPNTPPLLSSVAPVGVISLLRVFQFSFSFFTFFFLLPFLPSRRQSIEQVVLFCAFSCIQRLTNISTFKHHHQQLVNILMYMLLTEVILLLREKHLKRSTADLSFAMHPGKFNHLTKNKELKPSQ